MTWNNTDKELSWNGYTYTFSLCNMAGLWATQALLLYSPVAEAERFVFDCTSGDSSLLAWGPAYQIVADHLFVRTHGIHHRGDTAHNHQVYCIPPTHQYGSWRLKKYVVAPVVRWKGGWFLLCLACSRYEIMREKVVQDQKFVIPKGYVHAWDVIHVDSKGKIISQWPLDAPPGTHSLDLEHGMTITVSKEEGICVQGKYGFERYKVADCP